MTHTAAVAKARFRRIEAEELKRLLETPSTPLLLDVRRASAFGEHAGIPGAVAFPLDRDPILLPIAPGDRRLVAYCL